MVGEQRPEAVEPVCLGLLYGHLNLREASVCGQGQEPWQRTPDRVAGFRHAMRAPCLGAGVLRDRITRVRDRRRPRHRRERAGLPRHPDLLRRQSRDAVNLVRIAQRHESQLTPRMRSMLHARASRALSSPTPGDASMQGAGGRSTVQVARLPSPTAVVALLANSSCFRRRHTQACGRKDPSVWSSDDPTLVAVSPSVMRA